MQSTRLIASTCLLALLSCTSTAQTRRAMTPADTLRIANVGDAQISPDGTWVVYTVANYNADGLRSTLWIARTSEDSSQTALEAAQPAARRNPPNRLLSGDWDAKEPRWSPDSHRIAFLATEKDKTSLYVVSIDNHQPRMIATISETNFFISYAGESIAWSPDGKRIAFISAVDEGDSAGASDRPNDPRVIDRIQYKSRTSFSDNKRTHVFVIDADDERAEARQLTEGRTYDHAITWNPRGDEIAFLSNHELDPDANNNSDIFAVTTNGRVRQLTSTNGCEYEPQWSPDGKWIAYTATKRDVTTIDSLAEDTHVWVIDSAGGHGRELTAAQDRRARSPRWTRDSESILFLARERGQTLIFEVSVAVGKVQPVAIYIVVGESGDMPGIDDAKLPIDAIPLSFRKGIAQVQVTSFSVGDKTSFQRPGQTWSSSKSLAFTLGSATRPAEVWFGVGGTVPWRRISSHNEALIRTARIGAPEEFTIRSFDGTPIQAWLIKPLDWREGQRYPLILSIHGGLHGMYGYSFNSTFQVYAARGYAVLYMNPRGSSGYGQRFSDGTLREWGGGDYRDLMMGVDEALRRYSWIDADRLGVTGGSYGGFMTNWLITQTQRFKAAVSVASVSNLISFYSTSLYQDLIHAEYGLPWDDYDQLWRWSPLRYVRQAQTPTLLLHGEQDNDVHITQAEEMYMALRRRGVETELVRYPREGHAFREPRHRVDALERTIAWFDKYLR